MVEFVHNPEIKLFTEFIEELGGNPVLQQIMEKICIVIPGDREEDLFDRRDAFERNFKYIWYDEEKANQLGLSESECFACIAHELGHILDTSDRYGTQPQMREKKADEFAVKLGLGESLKSALDKMIEDNQNNIELVEGMEERKREIRE